MKKFIIGFFIFIVVLVAAIILGRNLILKTAVEQLVGRVTGFNTQVDTISFDFPSTLNVQGLKIHNPKSFKEDIFLSAPEIYASLVLPELLQGKRLHLTEVRINVQEVNIEKNEKGVSNVEMLTSLGGTKAQRETGQPKSPEQAPAPAAKKQMAYLVDRLELTIRNVSYQDAGGVIPGSGAFAGATKVLPGAAPKKVALDLNVQKEVFTNIDKPGGIINLILAKIFYGTTFGKLAGINPENFLPSQIGDAQKMLLSQSSAAIDKASALLDQQASALLNSAATQKAEGLLSSSLGSAPSAVGDAAGAAKNKLTGMFGKLKSGVQDAMQSGENSTETPAASNQTS